MNVRFFINRPLRLRVNFIKFIKYIFIFKDLHIRLIFLSSTSFDFSKRDVIVRIERFFYISCCKDKSTRICSSYKIHY